MKFFALVIVFLSGIASGYSQSEDSTKSNKKIAPWFVERFKFSAGALYLVNKTNIKVQSNGMNGTDIDAEKDLGYNKEIVTFLVNFQWRISRRSRISLNYYDIQRSATHTLQKDIEFEDNTYPANSSVYTFFNTAIYQFSYGYAILSKPKYEAGLLIGTHTLGAKAGISLNSTNTGFGMSNDFGFTAPLPDLGIWGGFEISKRFALNADVSYFALTANHTTGRLLAFNLTFTYKLVDELDISAGYSGLDFKVNTVKHDVSGDFKWGYNGPAIAVNFSFGKKSWGH